MHNHIAEQVLAAAVTRATVLRQQLHQIPELLFEEQLTAAAIRKELQELGVRFEAGVEDAATATIGMIGDPTRPCVALRADIDALPIEEASELPYRSRHSGRMHACGHDGHTATLLGAARVLQAMSDLPVCVKLIFQPAEEYLGGAPRLIKAGVLDGRIGPRPQAIFALHGWPSLPLGAISTRPGALMASTDNFRATFRGRGGHGAYPHLSRDPIVACAQAILSLQQIVSRESDPADAVVVTVGRMAGGSSTNIIPETAVCEGTIRTLKPETRRFVRQALQRRLRGIAAAHEVELQLEVLEGYPATLNAPAVVSYAEGVVRQCFGSEAFVPAAVPSMIGEDFAYYLEHVPGCFLFVGLRPPGAAETPGLHNPGFNYNDAALPVAIRLLVELALNWNRE